MWFLVACGGSAPVHDSAAPLVDPVAEAYASCVESVAWTLDGEAANTWHGEYDANGDLTHSTRAQADDPSADSEYTATYGAAHEIVAWRLAYPRAAVASSWTGTWDGGVLVAEAGDDDDDGHVDWSGDYGYDGDHQTSAAWDLDGDGEIDDTATYAWTAQGSTWSVLGDGVDPSGPYTERSERDAALRYLSYDYVDATGYDYRDAVTGYSAADVALSEQESEWQDDHEQWDGEYTRAVDELGRSVAVTEVYRYYEADPDGGEDTGAIYGGGGSDHLVAVGTWAGTMTYDCP